MAWFGLDQSALFAKSGGGHAKASVRSSRASAVRPVYPGNHHTTSHGGTYPGGEGASHKGGHYLNPASGDRYGIHSGSAQKGGSALLKR